MLCLAFFLNFRKFKDFLLLSYLEGGIIINTFVHLQKCKKTSAPSPPLPTTLTPPHICQYYIIVIVAIEFQ